MKVITCDDLDKQIALLRHAGYRLDMIKPADDPREAILSRDGDQVGLVATDNPRSKIQNLKSKGRAGMIYRDLIPDRLGGRVIASHITITEGGDVADYVHYHKLRFQMIYCRAGRIRVVYEDQGEAFDLLPGDCVLQPPEIRHRVLNADAGSEVIEISSPAEHETWVEHEILLPTDSVSSDRVFGRQRFSRHICEPGQTMRDLGIGSATDGLAGAKVISLDAGETQEVSGDRKTLFIYALAGTMKLTDSNLELKENDSIVFEDAVALEILAVTGSEVLVVTLPED